MTDKKYYITTPLYYVNAKPHIGHAYTNILCDTFARFHRFLGEDVFFMTGTDEHGTKIEKSATDQGMEPQAYVDSIVPHFESLWETLGIEYDHFFRTTGKDHKEIVQKILLDLEAKGEIYKSNYEGWYSIKSETFYAESELVDGKCPDTGGEVQKIVEENYFFKMSKYQDWLIEYITDHPEFIQPEKRRNEILGFLKQPLEDLCITRPKERLKWGIEYPSSKDHVIYVWFDALINYISGVQYIKDEANFNRHWPVDVQVLGKDIIRHHAVYWPIMLHACGLPMPKKLLVHGWWTIQGGKISKSSGNVVDPVELVNKYGVDAFRYFMLNEVTIGSDGAYSEDLLRERYRTDLANDLGNLWFRFASMLGKYFEGKIPAVSDENYKKEELVQEAEKLWETVTTAMKNYHPKEALSAIWKVLTLANQYVETKKPWALAKDADKKEELALTMKCLGETIVRVAVLLTFFLPETAQKILNRVGLEEMSANCTENIFTGSSMLKEGTSIERGEVLFPRLEDLDAKV